MKRYQYRALTGGGEAVSGVLEGTSTKDVEDVLARRGEIPISIREVRPRWWQVAAAEPGKKDLAVFLEDLATLHDAGMPLRGALTLLAESNGPASIRSFATLMAERLDSGADIGWAAQLSRSNSIALAAELARAGELSGRLGETLRVGALILSKQAEFLRHLREALAYPLFLLALSVVAIVALAVFAGPALAPLLDGASEQAADLEWLIRLGEFLRSSGFWVIALFFLSIGLVLRLAEREPCRTLFARARAASPLVGGVVRDLNSGAFARSFGALLTGGAPAARAMELAAASAPNAFWQAQFLNAVEALRDGATISDALASIPSVPTELTRLARVGEQAGAIGEMTSRAGAILIERAVKRLDAIAAMTGPALLICMGALIAWIMSAFLTGLSSFGEVAL